MSNQGRRQQSIRDATGTARDYNGDWHAKFDDDAIPAGPFNGRMIAWLQGELSSPLTNLDGLKAAYAASLGYDRWDDIGTFSLGAEEGDGLLLEGGDNLLLETGDRLLLE